MITRQLPDGRPYYEVQTGDAPSPSHDADACGQCTFVAHKDCIVVTPAQRAQAEVTLGKVLRAHLGLYDLEETIIPLGRFTMPGWTGHGMFWLFTCPECQLPAVDYLHGYRPYLRCPLCDVRLSVNGARFYEAAGLPLPPTRAQEKEYLRERKRQLGV